MHVPEEPDEPVQINVVPLIDVVLAVLTFFIMTSLYLTSSQGFSVNLPRSSVAGTEIDDRIRVTIDSQGQITLNDQPITTEQITPAVQALKGDRQTVFVVINADGQAYHRLIVAVMDQLRAIEGVKIGIATQS